MDFLKKRTLYLFSYLYLYIPVCIFLLAWIKPFVSIPLVILSAYYLFKSIGNHDEQMSFWKGNKTKIMLIMAVILSWVLLSGIGGFMWQNRWDHMFRNAIFNDLTTYSWPVINTDGENPLILCYYIGFWIPSALLVKITGIAMIGYIGQFIWGSIGVILSFFLISEWLKKVSYVTILIFIFFSGLDIASLLVLYKIDFNEFIRIIREGEMIDGMTGIFNSFNNTNSLFWVYNQIIPFWIGFMLVLLQQNNKYIFFTFSLLFFTSPLPFVGMIPLVLFIAYQKEPKTSDSELNQILLFVKKQLTISNFVGLAILIILSLYFQSNLSAERATLVPINKLVIKLFIVYIFFEFIIFIPFVYREIRANFVLFCISIITLFFCSFIQIGEGADFAWRTATNFYFFLMLLIIQWLTSENFKIKSFRSIAFILVLLIGVITPINEFTRTIRHSFLIEEEYQPFRSKRFESVFTNDVAFYGNFIGKDNTFFYDYLLRKKEQSKK